MNKNVFYKEFSKNLELMKILEKEEVRGSDRQLEQFNDNLYGVWVLNMGEDNEIKFIFEYVENDSLVVEISGDVIAKTSVIDISDYEDVQAQLAEFVVSLFNKDIDSDSESDIDDEIVDVVTRDATLSLENSKLIYKVYGKK